MADWMDDLAAALGEERLSPQEAGTLLGVARDVAHGVERRITPLAAFVIGSAVGRASAGGTSRAEALPTALETVRGLLPGAPAES